MGIVDVGVWKGWWTVGPGRDGGQRGGVWWGWWTARRGLVGIGNGSSGMLKGSNYQCKGLRKTRKQQQGKGGRCFLFFR